MRNLYDCLQKQLQTEYKKDAEDCLKIYEKLKEMNNGSVWDSQWRPLVDTIILKSFPNNEFRYKPTNLGYIFLKGIIKDGNTES